MISALRRRLALTFGLLTSLVLVSMLAITCYLSRSEYLMSQEALYQTQLQTITSQLQQSSSLNDSWLNQISRDQNAFFYVEWDDVPLHFSSISTRSYERTALLEALHQASARLEIARGSAGEATISLTAAGRQYQATICATSDYLLYYCQDRSGQSAHLAEMARTYLLLGVIGVSALLAVSWLLSRLATRPTAEAVRGQQEFVAAASHELRGPLTVIRASLYTLRQSVPEETGLRQLDLADQEAERMGRLISDLLTLAGEGSARWSLQPQAVELETVCIRLYELFLPSAAGSGHPLRLLLPEEPLPVIQSDQERLVQLLSVLLSNAVDHTPDGPPVELQAQRKGAHVLLSVIDHGPGIPDSEKEAVFRRFYRADRSRTDKRHFGLGLAIASELASLLGGQLTLTDTPGGGATFSLRLSVGKIRAKAVSAQKRRPLFPGTGKTS